jgi:hypothetical protein
MRESTIEKAFKKRVEKDLGGLCEKFLSPGKNSVPDRIVTLPGNRIFFAEIKAPGKKPSKKQERDHAIRRALGCIVFVIDSMEKANGFPFEEGDKEQK